MQVDGQLFWFMIWKTMKTAKWHLSFLHVSVYPDLWTMPRDQFGLKMIKRTLLDPENVSSVDILAIIFVFGKVLKRQKIFLAIVVSLAGVLTVNNGTVLFKGLRIAWAV